MEYFPDEILLMVFKHLPSRDIFGCVRYVCSRWSALVENYALCVEQKRDQDRINRRTRAIRLLVRLISFKVFLLLIPKGAPYLCDLTIHAANPVGPEHFTVLNELVHLVHLDIFLRDRTIDLQLLPVLLKLKSLVINEVITYGVIRTLAERGRLEALYMYGRSLYYPRRELAILLRVKRLHLRELVLRCNEMPDESYALIGQCEMLTSLQLYSCWLMTSNGIQSCTRPPHLRRLHITGALMVRAQSLYTFIEHIPQSVEELVLSKNCFGDKHISSLVQRLPSVRVLELWRSHLTAQGAIILAKALPSLRFLDLDIQLTNAQIRNLDTHPSLLFVRCLTVPNDIKRSIEPQAKRAKKLVINNFKLISTDECYSYKSFRSLGDGYRGKLYYYWMQDVVLEPIVNTDVPAVDLEDDED